jgi:hypothetical protein
MSALAWGTTPAGVGFWTICLGLLLVSLSRARDLAGQTRADNQLFPPPVDRLDPVFVPPILDLFAQPEAATDAADDQLILASPWVRVPAVRIVPRPGMFTVPPTGPGYYSFQDWLFHHERPMPPFYPYPPFSLRSFLFADADFRYLDRPGNDQHDFLDPLKRMKLGDNWMLAFGGEERFRQMQEVDSRLSVTNNNFQLHRTLLYSDLCYRDALRFFVEFIYADSENENLPPLAIDVNRNDLLNAFADVKITDLYGQPGYVRFGRQELLLGSQRLISPLEWANTRRTFDGVKLFRQGNRWDLDAFWVRPVIPDPFGGDSWDEDQQFGGLWTTFRRTGGRFLHMYYLYLEDQSPSQPPTLQTAPPPYHVNTLGAQSIGNQGNLLWDCELMYQFGERVGQEIQAGASAAGLGYAFTQTSWLPEFWLYYEWASGDQNPDDGPVGTFNQLFPFGHYYLGFLDLVGRQNIRSPSCQFVLYPTNWIILLAQYHYFQLDSPRDALYNAGGVAIAQDPTGQAGRDVGNELDLLTNIHLDAHQDILAGWSKLWPGEFLERTRGPQSPELFYVQYQFRW